jgi:hypothetical protein
MTDDAKTDDTGSDDKPTAGFIRQIVKEVLGEADSKVNDETATRQAGRRALNSRLDRDSEIEERVTAAVQQLKESEDSKREREGLIEQVRALTEKVKEKPPIERNWAHKLMGWGE